jgi:hypothetical protein
MNPEKVFFTSNAGRSPSFGQKSFYRAEGLRPATRTICTICTKPVWVQYTLLYLFLIKMEMEMERVDVCIHIS